MAKIAHVTTVDASLYFLLRDQLANIQADGHTVTGISSPGPFTGKLIENGIDHIAVRMTRQMFSPLRDLSALVHLVRILSREDFEVVHTHTPKAGFLGRVAAFLAGTPVVIHTIHGFHFHERTPWLKKRFFIFLERLAARVTDVLLSQNREDMDWAVSAGICSPQKIRFLGNGIDIDKFQPDRVTPQERNNLREELGYGGDDVVIGYVGRLEGKRKGLWDLLAAAKRVKEGTDHARFLFVGSLKRAENDTIGPEQAAAFGVADICNFVGEIPNQNLPPYYAAMDLLVLPSLYEGLPRAVMEAAAMKIPAVVSDVKGNREAVCQGKNGMLFPYGDEERLAAAILEFVDRPELRSDMAEGCREIAERKFDERAVFERLKRCYGALLAGRRMEP